jgi:magnesium chelatase accessory protein
LSFGEPDWDTDGRDWPLREHSRFVEHGGIRWHVQTLGSGPVLLLLHGTGASGHSFRALAPLLARRFTVVIPDLPGHAFSSLPGRFEPSLANMAVALGALVRGLGLEVDVAVGHSAGAALLVQMALSGAIAPRLLVGLASALVPFRGFAGALFPPLARVLARSAIAPWVAAVQARDPKSLERIVHGTGSTLDARGLALYQRLASRPGHVANVLAMLARWDLEPLYAALPSLRTPCLLLAGERDLAVPVSQQREVAARIPGARLQVLASAGHLLHEERPEEVARLILEAASPLQPLGPAGAAAP